MLNRGISTQVGRSYGIIPRLPHPPFELFSLCKNPFFALVSGWLLPQTTK
ncbi:Uncharacterised protein [Serratia grimesii]|nr:Uncharacterised protein [Serratia grimesii]CAI2786644.1 Uncharacterised protein [Serratia grimesii]CUW23574.1 Uncharacterised protein [Serratia grimesii]SMZ58224.1 Uncharacterised protein [Serratia grimesii]